MLNRRIMLAASAALIAMPTIALAADKPTHSTISVKGLHCDACAAKLCDALKKIPGVKDAKADFKKGVAIVVPLPGKKLPSPKAQWEMVEKQGYKPLRLAGPFGTFQAKPRF